ncbi:MAG: cytochrome c biogenesis protein CcsA [bacterium]|nr:cytochrome c biogenesis protein CcsA [bacterium]
MGAGAFVPFGLPWRGLFSREQGEIMVVVVVGLYLISTIAHLYSLFTQRRTLYNLGIGTLLLGFALHSVKLGSVFLSGVELGWGRWLSTLGWAILFLYVLVYFRYRDIALGGFAVPAGFLFEGYASAFPGAWGAGSPEVQGYLLAGHAVLAMLSAGAFFLLFVAAWMYIVQSRELKSKRPGIWLQRLPSLDVLDDLNHKTLYFGFTFLTTSLLLGSMWAKSTHGTYWSLDPAKTLPLVVVWFGYGILLVCRATRSWKGVRSAVFSIVAFLAVVFAMVGHL